MMIISMGKTCYEHTAMPVAMAMPMPMACHVMATSAALTATALRLRLSAKVDQVAPCKAANSGQ